jgi:hypothetical protein
VPGERGLVFCRVLELVETSHRVLQVFDSYPQFGHADAFMAASGVDIASELVGAAEQSAGVAE